MGRKSNKRKQQLLSEMKGDINSSFVKLPPVRNRLLKLDNLLPDLGEYLLNSGNEDIAIVLELGDYVIGQDSPGQYQLQGTLQGYVYSILTTINQGEIILENKPHNFSCKLSPSEEFKDHWGNRIVPLRLIDILG